MTPNEIYELKAAMFKRMTGFYAPGKDTSAAVGGCYETNPNLCQVAWNIWLRQNRDVLDAMTAELASLSAKESV